MIGRHLDVGQYLAVQTDLHPVDPRLKACGVLAGCVLVFVYDLVSLAAFAGMVIVILALLGLPLLKVFGALRTVWVILLVTFLLQVFLTPGEVVASWWFLSVTDTGLYNGALFCGRVAVLVFLLAALTLSTPPLRLADGMTSLLGPLERLGVPVGRLATVVSITLLFIPGVLEEGDKVMTAQRARGADFESVNILKRARDLLPVLVPLFVKVFRDSEKLSLAMDARGYRGGKGRTRLHPLKVRATHAVLTALFIVAGIALVFI